MILAKQHLAANLVAALGLVSVVEAADVIDLATSDYRFIGADPGARAGSALTQAPGAFAGPGTPLLIGAYLTNALGVANAGAAYLFDSNPVPGEIDLDTADFMLFGEEIEDRVGFAVAAGGDLNDDGINDVAAGAWGADGDGQFDSGMVFIQYGSAALGGTTMAGDADLTSFGQDAIDHYGWSLQIDGDLNGDGIDDLVVGSPLGQGTAVSSGEVFVFFGGDHLVSGTVLDPDLADLYFYGTEADAGVGHAIDLGDVNDDGLDDLLIGAPNADAIGRFNAGAAYVFLGSLTHTSGDSFAVESDFDVVLWGAFAEDAFGSSVAVVGDLDDDDFGDIVVGAPAAGSNDDLSGAVYVIAGGPIGAPVGVDVRTQANATLTGESPGDVAGQAVAWAGDVNVDGRPDFVVGAPGGDRLGRDGSGSAYVVLGSAGSFPPSGPLDDAADRIYVGAAPGDEAGAAVGAIIDYNQDGGYDLAVGAPGTDADALSNVGAVHVVLGDPLVGVDAPLVATSWLGPATPNPAARAVRVIVQAPSDEAARARVLDASGRMVRELAVPGGAGAVVWDTTDDHGRSVAPGVYFIRVTSGARDGLSRVTVIR